MIVIIRKPCVSRNETGIRTCLPVDTRSGEYNHRCHCNERWKLLNCADNQSTTTGQPLVLRKSP
eukprot:6186504-Pleurochrysis_carterae.AAC.2